jgi:cytidylate kinase
MELEQVNEKQARQLIKRMDKKRAEFNNTYSNDKWGVCTSYDLSISTSRFGIDGAVKAIMRLLE